MGFPLGWAEPIIHPAHFGAPPEGEACPRSSFLFQGVEVKVPEKGMAPSADGYPRYAVPVRLPEEPVL